MHQQNISVRGMHCRSCELLLEDSIGKIQGVSHVKANQKRGTVTIIHGDDVPSDREVNKAIEAAGYHVGQTGPLPWITESMGDWRMIVFAAAILVVLYFVLRGTGLWNLAVGDQNVTASFAIILGLVAGISTCMAIVGGLILGISARHAERHPEATSWQKFRPHLFFNLGRIVGYAVLGGLLGAIDRTPLRRAVRPRSPHRRHRLCDDPARIETHNLPRLAAVSLTLPSSRDWLAPTNTPRSTAIQPP